MKKIHIIIILLIVTIFILELILNKGNIMMALGGLAVLVILPLPLMLMKNKIYYILTVILLFSMSTFGIMQLNDTEKNHFSLKDFMKVDKNEANNKIKISKDSFKEFAEGLQHSIATSKNKVWLSKEGYLASSNYHHGDVIVKVIILKDKLADSYKEAFNIDREKLNKLISTKKFKNAYLEDFKEVNKKAFCLIPIYKVLFEKGLLLSFIAQYGDGEILGEVRIDNDDCNTLKILSKKPINLDKYFKK